MLSRVGEDKTQDAVRGQSRDELLEAYRDQVEFLRRELECKDTIIMSLTQRIPELEAPSAPSGAHETASEEPNIAPTHPRRQRRPFPATRSASGAGGGSSWG
jgi:hypothetical protein